MNLSYNEKFIYPYTNIKTEGKSLEIAPIPDRVKIPLLSAKFKVGVPVIQVGDLLLEGSPIGQSGDFFFYTGISGQVTSIESEEIRVDTTHILTVPTVSIQFSGRIVNWTKNQYDYLNRSAEELKTQIIKLGVENLNPTSCLTIEDILNFPADAHLVVTALDFAPMVAFCEELLLQKTQKIHTALSILEYIIKPKDTTVVVNKNLKNQYTHPQKEVLYLDATHPNGFEARLFYHFTGLDMVNQEMLKEKKYIFIDTQTLYHIYNAIVLKKPFMEQLVTIDGKVSQYPAHYFVKVGSRIKTLLEDTGIYNIPEKTISGNIFNADIIYSLERYVTPMIYSLFLLDEPQNYYSRFEDCIQCNLCHTKCPVHLFPYDLSQREGNSASIEKCMDCGICSYICPAGIPLGYFLDLKKKDRA